MSHAASPMRSQRARKSVPTYNLKVLSGIPTRRTAKRSFDGDNDDYSGPSNGSHEQMSSNGRHDDYKVVTPEADSEQDLSNVSSKLTSPTRSSGLAALETSLTGEATGYSPSTSDDQNKSLFECFNAQPHPKGHFYSANQLYAQGVWIGYLDPDRAKESFRGLPSLDGLRVNHNKFSPPHPPPVPGTARENRNAVCRGCASSSSTIIAFSEIQFVGKSKLVIMPLDGDDEAGVFAIMVTRKTDRSLNGLQIYRFYEISADATNNFMMLTLRNPDRDSGTLETVLEVLPLQERLEIAQRLKDRPSPSCHRPARPTSSGSVRQDPPLAVAMRVSAAVEHDAEGFQGAVPRKRRKSIKPNPMPEAIRTPEQTSAPLEPPGPPPRVNSDPRPVEIVSLDLTDAQARRTYLIWPFRDDDIDYEFVHTLDECKTFKGLLDLLEEDTEAIPFIADVMARTKTWRLTYEGADGANKAIVARKGTEVAFDRLQTTIAQLPIWSENPQARVLVELKLLSRPDSAAAV